MATPIDLPAWPGAARVAVSLTFDFDADTPSLGDGAMQAGRLSTLSAGRFGAVRGVSRILDLLHQQGIKATWYVPGLTAEHYPGAVREIADAGHEIGHHGYLHLNPARLTAVEQRDELERGLDALATVVGVKPTGYRAPAWELTPVTLGMLVDHGFWSDSSCMGDDRPYCEEGAGTRLLELPVDWSLDDWPYWGFRGDGGGNLVSPSVVLDCWTAEYNSALADKRSITYTMHPEVIGRGHRLNVLVDLIDYIKASGGAWFARHRDVAALVHPE
jgi:peptidoglycan/xylan/chitin deacetylase (PgdA/CDA1 family)